MTNVIWFSKYYYLILKTLQRNPATCTARVHERSMFSTKLLIKIQKAGFQNREDGVNFKKEET